MLSFPFNAYLAAFLGAAAATAVSLPLWRWLCTRIGLVDDPGHRKIHSRSVPLAGGLAVMTGLVLPILGGVVALRWGWLEPTAAPPLAHGWSRRHLQLAAIGCGALGMLGLGLLDDRHELPARVKFCGQLLIALLVASAGVRITLFVHNLAFSYLITVLWILTVVNAFNFMDNMNGLCSGLGVIGAWCFAWAAAARGQYLVALIALLICGALLGFLPYNFPRASAFLGDAGSHLIGFLMAVLAILPHFYSRRQPERWAVLTPLLVLAVPLLDMAWVVRLRWLAGRPFYVGDTNHLSHRLERLGLNRGRAVLVIWLLAVLAGGAAFL